MFFTNFCITISYTTISTGSAAAEFSVRAVPGFLKQFNSNTSPTDALTEAFVRTDIAFREELILHQKSKRITQKNWHPGCTAVTALIVRNKLFVANAGDCRAILNRAGEPFPMTRVRIIFLLYFARFLKFKHYNIRYVFILPW
jgi:serine/threonine protein phosphatase PrpC